MLWLVFVVLTLASIVVLLVPFLKKGAVDATARFDYDIVVYRNQLTEIDQEIERGLLTQAEANAARAEVHRRMLAAEDVELKKSAKSVQAGNRRSRLSAAIAIAVILPFGAAFFYSMLGNPQLPGKPYAWRQKNDPEFVIATAAEKLAGVLKNNPSASGYQHLAEMFFFAGNYEQAVAADRRAIQLGAKGAVIWSELGEFIVLSNDGAVVPEALAAFANALESDPRNDSARYYIGVAESQIGNLKQAVAIWRDLEKGASPDASWLPLVREHIAVFSKKGGFDPAAVPPSPPSAETVNAARSALSRKIKRN